MSKRYIDAERIPALFDEEYKKTRELIRQGETHLDNIAEGFTEATHVIRKMPTADVVEVRHGTWYHGTENGAVYAKCSACGRKMNYSCYGYAYCALCGAKMDGERKNDGT